MQYYKWGDAVPEEAVGEYNFPLETEVQTPDGKALCYFPAALEKITTAKGGRMAGLIGYQLVLLEIVGMGGL